MYVNTLSVLAHAWRAGRPRSQHVAVLYMRKGRANAPFASMLVRRLCCARRVQLQPLGAEHEAALRDYALADG